MVSRQKYLRTQLSSNLAAHDLQHDQLPGAIFVSQSNNSTLVMAHGDVEYVHAGAERADF